MLRSIRVGLTIILASGLVLSACAQGVREATLAPTSIPSATATVPAPTPTNAAPSPYPPQDTPATPIELTPVPTEEESVTVQVPAVVMNKIMADLEQRIGSKPDNVTIIKSEAVTWNDGSLGCPKRGVFYIQVLVEGYWVILQVGQTQYDYRVGGSGTPLVLCES
jgi:hypothetical protein